MNPIEIEDDIRKLEATGLKFHGNPTIERTQMKKCGNNKCTTMLSDGSPELCPKCQERGICPTCKGYKKTVRVHNEALTPSVREGKCKTCNGKGRVAKPSNGQKLSHPEPEDKR